MIGVVGDLNANRYAPREVEYTIRDSKSQYFVLFLSWLLVE